MSSFGHVPTSQSYFTSPPVPQVLGGATRIRPGEGTHIRPVCLDSSRNVPPHSAGSCASSAPTLRPPSSHSTCDNSPSASTPRKKRSRRCFVCGGTGKHRLHPRFCPRTAELFDEQLVMFDFAFRLVAFDGSPLPMTRHPGGVAAHLLSPQRLSAGPTSMLPRTSKSNPPHIAVPCRIVEPSIDSNPPHAAVPHHIAKPSVDSDPPHMPHSSGVPPHAIPSSHRSTESILSQFPPVDHPHSPTVRFPVRVPHCDSKPIADPPDDSSPHVALSIFDILFVSPPVRDKLRELINGMDRLNIGYEIPTSPMLRKVFYRILDQILDSLSSLR
ncbi:hypothetical protein C8R45DRAFT_992920 [Mycena sanguinolenta]|nr:hypothetical protein C8R45DRAFT_992920 [Mycena sanguinolenta]